MTLGATEGDGDYLAPRRKRFGGLALTVLVHVVLLGGFLVQRQIQSNAIPPAVLSVFNVAAPAAPAEPHSEAPPGPEQVETHQQELEPPEIVLASDVAVPATEIAVAPTPPVPKTSAPESKPVPPALQPSNEKPTWEGLVLAALNKVKRYPRTAQFRKEQGVPFIRFTMDRQGKLLSSALERSSGFRSLDDEALSLPRRAQPLPAPPDSVKGDTIEMVVPVEFFVR